MGVGRFLLKGNRLVSPTSALVRRARHLALAGVRPGAAPDGLAHAVQEQRGELAEERVLAAIERGRPRPWWLLEARRATRREDAGGVDIVVLIADGPRRLQLQVKSSLHGLQNFKLRGRELGIDARDIAVVIAPPHVDEAGLWGRALGALLLLRERRGL